MKKILLSLLLLTVCTVGFSQYRGFQRFFDFEEQKAGINKEDVYEQGVDYSDQFEKLKDPANRKGGMDLDALECGFVHADQLYRQQHPNTPSIDEFEVWLKGQIKQSQTYNLAGPRCNIMYVPYVVHVMHPGQPVNAIGAANGVNISAAQVQSQIDALNDAYRKVNFSRNDSPMWDDVAADFQIKFVPAVRNPETGETLAEPGINRIDLPANGFPTVIGTTSDEVFNTMNGQIKPATIWDPEKVFNIWIGDFASQTGLLGYAQFPEPIITGIPEDRGANTDGVVCDVYTFQRQPDNDGSFSAYFNNYNLGKTTIHEVGHWVGLRHSWGDGGCGVDDFVADTPLQAAATAGCPVAPNTCVDSPIDLPDQFQNYMDYSNDACTNLFTQDQKDRSDAIFAGAARRASLLNSDIADYPERTPYVMFEVEDLVKDVVEADGCSAYTDYEVRVRLLECADMEGDIQATISVDASSTVEEGVDYDFIDGKTVTLSGTGPEIVSTTLRVFSDGVDEGAENLVLTLSLDAGGTDAMLHPDDIYTEANWVINDALVPDEKAEINLEEEADVDTEACGNGDFTLTINFDNWSSETSWEITDDETTVLYSGGPYDRDTYANSSIEIPIELETGAYTFTMLDSYGDGIGSGSWSLEDTSGYVAAEGTGNFGSFVNQPFCVDAGGYSFNGVLPMNGEVKEIENCTDEYAEYLVAMSISECVSGEQDVTVSIKVDPASTATEGEDFIFPEGKEVVFTGEEASSAVLPIRFLNDGIQEGNETLIFELVVDKPAIVDLGNVRNEITIIDVNSPALVLASSLEQVREGDYSCESESNNFMLMVSVPSSCADIDGAIDFTIQLADGSVAEEGVDFDFVNGNSGSFTPDNIGETIEIEVVVYNDFISEGREDAIFEIVPADPQAVSTRNSPLTVQIWDALGNSAPSFAEGISFDFESGTLDGWVYSSTVDDPTNVFTVSENTGLGSFAAHITSDPSSQSFTYAATPSGSQFSMIASNQFLLNQDGTPFNFDFQVEGEVLFIFIFDRGFVGLVPGNVDVTDGNAVLEELFGYSLLLEPAPTNFHEYLGREYDLNSDFIDQFGANPVRLVYAWTSDSSVQNQPPLGVDNISLPTAITGNFIETSVLTAEEIPSYIIKAETDTYFYNKLDNDVMMHIVSSEDNGCTEVYVDEAGTGATQFLSGYTSEYRADKTFVVEPATTSEDDALTVGLYYTEDEIAGWEEATGKSRDELYVFKNLNGKVNSVDPLCVDYREIDFAKATLTPSANGFKVTASFETGLSETTGFGISAIPTITPGEFTAVQNQEQVDITFVNKYDESQIAYYIFTTSFPDAPEVEELIIVDADGSGTYNVTDYFPRNGLNIYSVTYVLKNGDKFTVCYDASVFYKATEQTKIYPNPAQNTINILVSDDDIKGATSIAIYDEYGRVVSTRNVSVGRAVLRYQMDVSTLAAGTYYVKVKGDRGESVVGSFVKVE